MHKSSEIESVSALHYWFSALLRSKIRPMASSGEDGAAATAAQQLRSMSLGETVESKDDDTEPTPENETTPTTKMCSACGKESDTLKKCRACKCVWYCDKDCQNKHRKGHKIECKRVKKELDERGGKLDIGTELDVGPLGKLPPREECPICMHVLPICTGLQAYFACCGKIFCTACDVHHQTKSGGRPTCPFCRTPLPESDEKYLEHLRKRIELKDPKALFSMAIAYSNGKYGLPVDQHKCIELLRQSADLGHPPAQNNLGNYYHTGAMGLEQNEEEVIKYWEKAAEGGNLLSLHDLGHTAYANGDIVAAMRHFHLSASGGYRSCMNNLIVCFEKGFLHHGDLAESLQAFYRSRAEMSSKDRDRCIDWLKRTGKYQEDYDI